MSNVLYLVIGSTAPEVRLDGLSSWHVDRLLEWEVDGEPGEHVGCVAGWVGTQMHGPIPA